MDNNDIRNLRKFLGLTQPRFATLLGVSVASVRRWEKGSYDPSPLALEKLQREVEKLKTVEP